MGDNIWLADRHGVRTPMQWSDAPNAGFSAPEASQLYAPIINAPDYGPARVNVLAQRADPQSLWHTLRRMIATRKQHRALGWGDFTWVDCGSQSIAAYQRAFQGERLLVANNLSETTQTVTLPVASAQVLDVLTDAVLPMAADSELALTLGPYQYRWLKL